MRLRWFDPTTGTYVDISDSEAQRTNRSVSYPSAHQDGTSDWVLVVDLAGGMTPPTTTTILPTTTAVGPDDGLPDHDNPSGDRARCAAFAHRDQCQRGRQSHLDGAVV